ncbi:MAG: Coenzyme F420 hydrogenase/dehydrogenase, beta subunit C-terminal domain [Methanobacterium formicicum]
MIIDDYIKEVTKGMGPDQQKEVSEELKTHILDSADAIALEKNVEVNEEIIAQAISLMGTPKKLAKMYPKLDHTWKLDEIVESDMCAKCGTCAVICPNNILSFDGKPELTEECLRNGHGMCFEVCPRVSSGKYQIKIREKFTEEMYYGRGSSSGQDGGAVTTFLKHLLENDKIDGAIVVGDEYWKPVSLIVRNAEDLLKTSKSKYTISTLEALKTAGDMGLEKVAIVALPCQINGLRKLQYFPYLAKHEEELGRTGKPVKLPKIEYLIGLFCTEKFDYGNMKQILEDNQIKMEDVEKFNVKKGKLLVQVDGEEKKIDLAKIELCAGCKMCRDFDAEMADVSIGSVGSPVDYSTIIIRTPKGQEIKEALELEEGVKPEEIERLRQFKLKRFQKELERRKEDEEFISFYWASDYAGVASRADGTYFIRIRAKPAGWYEAQEIKEILDVAEEFGARIKMTNRGAYELHDITGFDVEEVVTRLNALGLVTGSEGPLVRATLACPGKENCGSGLIDTTAICKTIEERFMEKPTPYKFKIAVSGCPNKCMRPQIHDAGIAGIKYPQSNEDECNGCGRCSEVCKVEAINIRGETSYTNYDICVGCGKCMTACPHNARETKEEGFMLYIGGKAGRELVHGFSTKVETVDEVTDYIDSVLRVYNKYADKPQRERLASTIKRIGQTKFINEVKEGL